MIRIFLFLLLILLICNGRVTAQNTLSARIDTLMKILPPGSDVGISVFDLTDNKAIYSYKDEKLSRPASTMKLLTGITALSQKNANEPFLTEAWYKGIIVNDTLRGDIYVVGGFDPEFDDAGMDKLINDISSLPIKVVQGKVYGDISIRDSLYWGSGWLWDDDPASFQPYMSPLMFHKGMVKIRAIPTIKGDTAKLEVIPQSGYFTVINHTKSKTPAAGKFKVDRNWLESGNTITVSGNVNQVANGEVNVYSSQDFFMHTFMERLRDKGLTLTDTVYGFAGLVRDSTALPISRWSTSMQDVLDQMMKESDNLNAEAVLYKAGKQFTNKEKVTAEDGLAAIEQLITEIGHKPEDYKLADGSGLSNYNYVSPALLVDLLKYAYSKTDLFRQLYISLPTAGIDGTLKHRMKGTKAFRNVTAKTGSFTGIYCIAGYIQRTDGHYLAFAIMNQNIMTPRKAREFQDKVCELLMTP